MNKTDLAQLKVKYTEWANPDVDEAKFWHQCAAVAEIDPNWVEEMLNRRGLTAKPAVIDEVQDE